MTTEVEKTEEAIETFQFTKSSGNLHAKVHGEDHVTGHKRKATIDDTNIFGLKPGGWICKFEALDNRRRKIMQQQLTQEFASLGRLIEDAKQILNCVDHHSVNFTSIHETDPNNVHPRGGPMFVY